MARLFYCSLCLFGAIVELHAMDEKNYSMTFSLGIDSGLICNKGLFNS